MITIGLDLSLTHTGYAIVKDGGKVLASGVIKSKPSGDRPVDETRRIVKIAEDVMEKIDELVPDTNPQLVVIEGLAFMARNTSALVQLAGLNYLVRILLEEFKWPFVIVAPSTLKKFITGKGNGEKDLMMMTVFKDYGFESMDNNECDAYSLAVCGLALMGKPISTLTKPQLETLAVLKPQL